jgi:hypothetical protein
MPKSSRFLRAPENAEAISAALPTNTFDETYSDAGSSNVSAAFCTDSTKTR